MTALPVTITLQTPITVAGQTLNALTIARKPMVKDFKGMPAQMGMDEIVQLIGRLTNEPPSTIGELGMEDFSAVMEVVGPFLMPGQQGGSES